MKITKKIKRKNRHLKIRKRIFGTEKKPRLSVFRSNTNFYAQIINDEKHNTLLSFCTKNLENKKNNIESAFEVGEKIAELAISKGVKEVVFDRSGFLFHGKVKAFADGARKKGLKF